MTDSGITNPISTLQLQKREHYHSAFPNQLPNLVDCVWDDFGDWGDCSTTCGDGKRSRIRTISTPASGNGEDCIGDATEQETCNDGECPGWRTITY